MDKGECCLLFASLESSSSWNPMIMEKSHLLKDKQERRGRKKKKNRGGTKSFQSSQL